MLNSTKQASYSDNWKTASSFNSRCYQSVMPPPPHNMTPASNKNIHISHGNHNNHGHHIRSNNKNLSNNDNYNNNGNGQHGKNNYKNNSWKWRAKNNNGQSYQIKHEKQTTPEKDDKIVGDHNNNQSNNNNNNKNSKNKGNVDEGTKRPHEVRRCCLNISLNGSGDGGGQQHSQHNFQSHQSPQNSHAQQYKYNTRSYQHYSNRWFKRNLVDVLMDKLLSRAGALELHHHPEGAWDSLSQQMWQKFTLHQQREETYRKKVYLWKLLYTSIRNEFPRYGLFIVGSTMSGFGLDSSDVDMCLLVRPTAVDQRIEAPGFLERVQATLRQKGVQDAELIWAKVPILKFSHAQGNIRVDLNCNNSVGIRNTHLLYCYALADWRVRPLVLIVKLWASINNINEAKNMTISSYSLALMVIHYLQCGTTPPVVPCLHGLYPEKFRPDSDIHAIDMHERLPPFRSDNGQTLGELFFGFLRYYTCFNYVEHAISVRLGARISIEECRAARDPHHWRNLCIEEPFDLSNTARSVYDDHIFEHIKKVFAESYTNLLKTRDLGSIIRRRQF